MATVTDEDVLELVERFDIDIEDTTTIDKLTAALAEKLEAAGVPYVSKDFLDKFTYGIELKYEKLPEVAASFSAYHRPSTAKYPGGWWQGTFRDLITGRFMAATEVKGRMAGLV